MFSAICWFIIRLEKDSKATTKLFTNKSANMDRGRVSELTSPTTHILTSFQIVSKMCLAITPVLRKIYNRRQFVIDHVILCVCVCVCVCICVWVVALTLDVISISIIDGISCQTTLKNLFLQEMEIENGGNEDRTERIFKTNQCTARPVVHYCGSPCSILHSAVRIHAVLPLQKAL